MLYFTDTAASDVNLAAVFGQLGDDPATKEEFAALDASLRWDLTDEALPDGQQLGPVTMRAGEATVTVGTTADRVVAIRMPARFVYEFMVGTIEPIQALARRQLVITGPLDATVRVLAILPAIATAYRAHLPGQGADHRLGPLPLGDAELDVASVEAVAGLPTAVSADVVDQSLLAALCLVALPARARVVQLAQLWSGHDVGDVSTECVGAITRSLADVAAGASDHAERSEQLRAEAAMEDPTP